MDDNLTDQQQAERIKNWLKENGKFLIGGLVLGVSGFFSIQFFQQNKLKEAEMASQLYSEIEFCCQTTTIKPSTVIAAKNGYRFC